MKPFILSLFVLSVVIANNYTYCVPSNKVDFNPYREIVDGKDILYFIPTFIPYISGKEGKKSIIKAYEFSPDGKLFRGRVTDNLKWSDGTEVVSKDVINNFSKILPFRPIGARLKIKDTKIIDDKNFEIEFKSNTKNITGILIEALKPGSRQNRFWMYESKNKYVGRLDIKEKNKETYLVKRNNLIKLVNKEKCMGADFGVYPNLLNTKKNKYEISRPNNPQAITAVFNTNVSLKKRKRLATMLIQAFKDEKNPKNIQQIFSFFKIGEVGYHNEYYWKDINDENVKEEEYKIFYEIPVFKDIVKKKCKKCLFYNRGNLRNLDVQLLSSYIPNGRHVILQDILKWNFVNHYLNNSKLTKKYLELIAQNSNTTHLNNGKNLKMFEISSKKEMALLPLARREIWAYSKPNLQIQLVWDSNDDLIFILKE